MKKLFIIGASGLTGYKIAIIGSKSFEIHGTFNTRPVDIKNCSLRKLDVTSPELEDFLNEIKPDVVVNASALHNVDFCETNPKQSKLVNTESIKNLNNFSKKLNFKLIHISTDYVFDGLEKKPYTETDVPKPLNVYGKTKLEGEKVLDLSRHVVIRPSVVFGWTKLELAGSVSSSGKPMNFAMWLLSKLNKNESIKIVTDQFATATLADSIAESILKIIDINASGIYHVAGLSCESRYEFSIKLAKKFGYSESLISPTTSSEFVQKAKRPSYSCLNCDKATKNLGLKLLKTDQALDLMKNQVEKEAPNLLNN